MSRPLRVLFVNENIGGHATVHLNLAAALGEYPDIRAEFLTVPPPSWLRRAVGVRVPPLDRLDLDLQPLRAQLALSAWVRRRLRHRLADADAVHLYTHNAGLVSAGLLRAVPTVVTLDGTNAMNAYRLPYRKPTRFTPRVLPLTQFFERKVYAAAGAVVANSAQAAESLRQDYGVSGDHVRLIRFGVTGPAFDPPAAPGTGPVRRPQIVFVGTSLARKGGQQLLRVHQRLFAQRCELVLVTHDRVPPASGVTVVDDLRPGDRRLWELLRESAVFVFPSGIDQAPNVVLEAMAAGLPVVACPVGAVPEMVRDGITGRLVPVGDDEALAGVLRELLDDPPMRARMGAAGRARFEGHYDMARSVGELLAVVREVVERHPRNRP
ncbi:MAG: glycosyltransferase family 4 protein [Geodermatophilaceae bacterium]